MVGKTVLSQLASVGEGAPARLAQTGQTRPAVQRAQQLKDRRKAPQGAWEGVGTWPHEFTWNDECHEATTMEHALKADSSLITVASRGGGLDLGR